jgi:hypothetical protein
MDKRALVHAATIKTLNTAIALVHLGEVRSESEVGAGVKTVVALEILAFSLLFIVALIPSVVSQEDYSGTWVGSLSGTYTEGGIEARIPDSFTVAFTVYLTITVDRGGSFVGREKIGVSGVTWIETDPYIVVKKYRVRPMGGDVEINGWISSDKRLYCLPERTVAYHVTLMWSLLEEGKEVPQPSVESDGATFSSVNCGVSGYVDVSVKRAGNVMRISGSESIDPWIASHCTGTLVLQQGATCIEVPRDASILRNGTQQALVQGADISSGDVIKTGGNGKATLSLPDGSELKLLTDTSVQLTELLESKAIKLTLLSGEMWFYVIPLDSSVLREKFEVKTLTAIAGVRDTEFTVEVAENGTATLIVLEGIVEFSDLQQTKIVAVGQNQTSTSTPSGTPSDPTMLDPELIQRWWEEPAVILMETDLNQDGAVNILDLNMVARAFRTKPGDARWNAFADLDNNNEVNIFDLFKVARDFGK